MVTSTGRRDGGTTGLLLAVSVLIGTAMPAAAQTVTVGGIVVDSSTGQPVGRAMVYLLNGRSTETDANGHFRLGNANPARDVLLVRRIGYAPLGRRLSASSQGPELDLGTLYVTPLALMLDSLSIQAEAVALNPRLAEFYDHRRIGMGTYFTGREIWERNPVSLAEIVRAVPGIVIRCQDLVGACIPAMRRPARIGQEYCNLQVVLDGIPTTISLNDIPPGWIAGLEIYKSAATTPLRMGTRGRDRESPERFIQNASCGTVAIWTGGNGQ